MAEYPDQFWLILDHNNQVIHQSADPVHLELMQRYVRKSREVGDDWSLVQYSFDKVVLNEEC